MFFVVVPVSGVSAHCAPWAAEAATDPLCWCARLCQAAGHRGASALHRLTSSLAMRGLVRYRHALGPAPHALLTRTVSYYCDRYGTQKEYEWIAVEECHYFRQTFILRNLTTGSAFCRQKIPVMGRAWFYWVFFFLSIFVSELICLILIKSKSFETSRNDLQFGSLEQ